MVVVSLLKSMQELALLSSLAPRAASAGLGRPPKRMLTDHSLRALPAWQVSEHVPLDGNSHEILEVHL